MATIKELGDFLASHLGVNPNTVAWTSRTLREAGLLPGRGKQSAELADADAAASLLVALLAADRPSKAVEAVKVYGALPARRIQTTTFKPDGQSVAWRKPTEDICVEPGSGEQMARLARNLISALAELISLEGGCQTYSPLVVIGLTVSRNLGAPQAIATFEIPAQSNPTTSFIEFVSDESGTLHDLASLRLQSFAHVGGAVIRALGYFLEDKEPTTSLTRAIAAPILEPAASVARKELH